MYIGDNVRFDTVPLPQATTVAQYSKVFSLKDVDKVSVVCGLGTINTTATALADFSIVVGKSTEGASSMAALVGATLSLGTTEATAYTNVDEVLIINHTGTDATGWINIDGTTWKISATGTTLSEHVITGTDSSGFIHALACAIATGATHLELTKGGTGATNAYMTLRVKDGGFGSQRNGFDISIHANNSSDGLEMRGVRKQGVIEFTPGDVTATNSSYDSFAVRLGTAVATAVKSIVVARIGGFNATQDNAVRL